jgi:hypothetical protein
MVPAAASRRRCNELAGRRKSLFAAPRAVPPGPAAGNDESRSNLRRRSVVGQDAVLHYMGWTWRRARHTFFHMLLFDG